MHPTYKDKFDTKITSAIVVIFSFLFLNTTLVYSQDKKFIVVLDAGHGGNDPGNIGNGYREKTIALKVVKEIRNELQKINDIKVILTRDKDVLINLWKRGEIANKAKADLFVSIHCDSHSSNAYGAGTFVLGLHANKRNFDVAKRENAVISLEDNYRERYKGFDPNSEESVLGLTLLQEENLDKSFLLAADIQQNFSKALKRKNRGVKQAGFVVLHQTYMPSVLIELGFLTNKNEGKFLNSKSGQQKMAKEIAKSIKRYYNQLKLNTVAVNDQISIENTKVDATIRDEDKFDEEVVFKIQIASSKNKIQQKSYNFKGLKNVQRVKVGSYYKYYFGVTTNYNKVKNSLLKAKSKGYSDAYIAAFKKGKKVSLIEVLK
ncbi:N-acetylmuramoyl-L-alanine amidase [Flavobacteriaceae bacterium]|nr:N-acetylmuramoyl-L-alanine amidase [Flavobacteriaceae bacterium]MDB2427514.1 N-acetylmuramoyl-L-alanine amidase [Flavobacteriaceae bacterium]MDB2684924.1 N-acetylmuramoyl-L-alanine amidase [Flavobacteriaceae bacterium]MDC0636608.1 N-acetylmuramoyl-L-alanine amidase [Flavobacteriaceae bacterium]MDC0869763.1 N-acetylmuramoyl-L-alanine amidase [Flavobacteriaceae bacterium]